MDLTHSLQINRSFREFQCTDILDCCVDTAVSKTARALGDFCPVYKSAGATFWEWGDCPGCHSNLKNITKSSKIFHKETLHEGSALTWTKASPKHYFLRAWNSIFHVAAAFVNPTVPFPLYSLYSALLSLLFITVYLPVFLIHFLKFTDHASVRHYILGLHKGTKQPHRSTWSYVRHQPGPCAVVDT